MFYHVHVCAVFCEQERIQVNEMGKGMTQINLWEKNIPLEKKFMCFIEASKSMYR